VYLGRQKCEVGCIKMEERGGRCFQSTLCIWLSLFSITHTFLLSYVQYTPCRWINPSPPNLTPTGLIMQRVRAAWGVIGAADACVLVGYSQMFSLRFQVNCLTVTNFELQFPASVPVCGAERRCVLVSISALYYRIHRVRGLALMGTVASCVISSSSSKQ